MARLNYEKANRSRIPRANDGENLYIPRPRYREPPATDKQLHYLRVLWARHGQEGLDAIDQLKLTKAEASRQIKALAPAEK